MFNEDGSDANITFEARATVGRLILDTWLDAVSDLAGVELTGVTLGNTETGYEVWDVSDEDVARGERLREERFQTHAPKQHKKWYGSSN
jgi:hypothetical protein